MKNILLIGGPTCAGKSAVAFRLAREAGGEIVSADSRQFYRGLDIGTDKPPARIRTEVPHHLLDCCSLGETCDIFAFSRAVTDIIGDIFSRGRIPIVVGGSGLYLRVLSRGIFTIPVGEKNRQKRVRDELENLSTEQLLEELSIVDPESAARIHPHDRRRIRRALEVHRLTGSPISKLQRDMTISPLAGIGMLSYFILTRSRDNLHERIARRVDEMFSAGWITEVERLRAAGYAEHLRISSPIGYTEILDLLDGKTTREQAAALIKKKTKALARRQLTWFRKEPGTWLEMTDDNEDKIVRRILTTIREPESVSRDA